MLPVHNLRVYLSVHWLDADTIIQASNWYYAFDIAPTFWEFIEEQARLGVISCPQEVFREVGRNGNEYVQKWIKAQRSTSLFCRQDKSVQGQYAKVVQRVYQNQQYTSENKDIFFFGADPWLVAHAWTYGGKVISRERRQPDAKKPKVPDVCAQFGVEISTPWAMLRSLGFRFK